MLGSIASLLRTIQRTARHTTAIWRGQKICENKALCVTDNIVFRSVYFCPRRDWVLRISGDGDERGIWIGLKFLILGFLGVGKLRISLCRGGGKGGTLDLSRDFSGIQNNLKFRSGACVSRACRSANKVQRVMSFFGRIFFLGGGGGIGFFSPFDHVRHLKYGLLNLFSWLSVLCTVTYILSHFP